MKYIHFSNLFRWKFGIGCSIIALSCISGITYSDRMFRKIIFEKIANIRDVDWDFLKLIA